MSANDGGPAFPFKCQWPTTGPEFYYGMSLRDWFAGQALHAILADHETLMVVCKAIECDSEQAAAHMAYEVADAMLKAREMKQ